MKTIFAAIIATFLGVIVAIGGHIFFAIQKPPLIYASDVSADECALCGVPNPFRGVDTIAILDTGYWKIYDIGMTRFCGSDAFDEACPFMQIPDQALTWEQLEHKYAPLDIHGVMREHPSNSFYVYQTINQYDQSGTRGHFTRISDNHLFYGALETVGQTGANPEYLSSILCQGCFDAVYALTKNTDLVFLDCLTNEVYSIRGQETYLQIRDYRICRLFQTQKSISFVGVYGQSREIPVP